MSFYVYASEGVTKQANEVEPLIQMFNFSHCPVCNNELKIDVTESWNKKIVNGMQYSCKSKCFEYSVIRNREHKVTIFNNKFEAPYEPKAIVEQVRNDVNRKINHFKRKNRYIAEILLR
ncbi:hypothetical protein D3C81_1197500 [compost metagenome]